MSAPNVPIVQYTYDGGDSTVVKITGYYTQATNSNTLVVQANSLAYANNSQPCVLSVMSCQYAAGFANGYCQLQWVSPSNGNADILVLGGKTSSVFQAYMPNPIALANSANLNANSGDIGLSVVGAEPFDSFSLVLVLNKEGGASGGYANVYTGYNDPGFNQPTSPI